MKFASEERFPLPFLITAALALLIGLWLRLTLNFNAPYLDESDYCFVGRALLDGKPWNTLGYVFSSKLPLWIIGIGDAVGGHLAARMLSALLGIASLFFFYRFAGRLFPGRNIALIATALLSLAAPHIFISKFATYDIICFFFFSASLWTGAIALTTEDDSLRWTLATALLFFLAVMSKYIAVGYAPLFALLLFARRKRDGLLFALLVAGGVLGYIWINREALLVLYRSQILGSHQAYSGYAQVLGFLLQYCAAYYLLALAGYSTIEKTKHNRLLFLALLLCSLPLIAYHLRSRDLISSYKHMIYPAAFLAPAGAFFLNRLLERSRSAAASVLPGIILLAIAGLSVYQVRQMENAYPNTNRLISFMKGSVTPQTKIMSEDPYLFRYYFYPEMGIDKFAELGYHDNNMDGKYEEQDVIDAVWDGKFDYVYLNYQIMPALAAKLREGVLPHSYERVYEEKFECSEVMRRNANGIMELYRRKK